MYKINPTSYSSVFVVPTQIADKHLRMAGKAQLKVLLWLYRNPNTPFEIDVVSRDTGIPRDEIDDAMLYWIDAGLVLDDEQKQQPVSTQVQPSAGTQIRNERIHSVSSEKPVEKTDKNENASEKPAEKEKKVKDAVIVKPSIKDIAMRLNESSQVASLFNEVQELFGRTLGYEAQANLLMLHDQYGLPAEVIVMICSYAKTIGKGGAMAYIVQTGKSWADEGITDFDSAGRKIARLEKTHDLWDQLRTLTGLENPKPTTKQSEFLEIWANDYGYGIDIIHHAYEKTVEKKGKINFGYMNGTLRSWKENGYKTIEEIERAAAEFTSGIQKKKTQAQPQQKQPSYDIELAMAKSRMVDPTKTKRRQ